MTQTYGYDSIGNLTSRSDLGAYTYGSLNNRPHGITQIALSAGGRRTYTYDSNGNLTNEVQYDSANNVLASKGRTATYTSFDMPKVLASPSATLTFTYGTDHQRIKQVSPASTTIYVHPDDSGGLSYEKLIKPDGTVEHRYFIGADQMVAIVKQTGATTAVRYLHQDHLGSVMAVTNETGAVVERLAYEPFGKRRYPNGSLDTSGALKGVNTNRGYTADEQLDDLGLIHMNGRVYDPAIGRFMSADPSVPHPEDPQSFNRYSYTRNNPLAFVDPTGFADAPPQTIPIHDKGPAPEQIPFWFYRVWRVDQTVVRDEYGGELNVFTAHVQREPAKTVENTAPSGPSWTERMIAKIQAVDRGLRATPRWESEYEFATASMPGSVSHGLHPLYGAQPHFATMGNAMYELLKDWAGLSLDLVLSSPGRAVRTATRLPFWTATKAKTAVQNAYRHSKDHGAEFAAKNSADYVKRAQEFLRNPPEGTLTRVRSNGDVVRYHPDTNTFGVMDSSGAPRTMFKPDPAVHGEPSNLDYFHAQ